MYLEMVGLRAVPRNSYGGGGGRAYILPRKMGMVPMTEEYQYIREEFMKKCMKLTSFPLNSSTQSFFLGS